MYDFQRAFKFFTKDNCWVSKFVTGGFMLMIPTIVTFIRDFLPSEDHKVMVKLMPVLIPAYILLLVFTAIVSGYRFKLTNRIIEKKDASLPSWGAVWEYIIISLKSVVGTCCIALPFVLLFIVLFFVGVILSAINHFLILIPIILGSLIGLLFILLTLVFYASFSVDLKLSSFFNFARIGALLKGNMIKYVVYCALMFGLATLQQTIIFVLGLTVIGILAVPFVSFYMVLVNADLTGQFVLLSGAVKNPGEVIEKR